MAWEAKPAASAVAATSLLPVCLLLLWLASSLRVCLVLGCFAGVMRWQCYAIDRQSYHICHGRGKEGAGGCGRREEGDPDLSYMAWYCFFFVRLGGGEKETWGLAGLDSRRQVFVSATWAVVVVLVRL